MELAVNKIAKSIVALAVMTAMVGCNNKPDTKPEPLPITPDKPAVYTPPPAPIADPSQPTITPTPGPSGPVVNGNKNHHTPHPAADASDSVTLKGAKTYVVKAGDSLSKIAAKVYGKSTKKRVDAIKKANHLKSDVIRVGQKLKIPPASAI
jgi:nucleoid-associated protein YgaU